jgi:hypothetical protein
MSAWDWVKDIGITAVGGGPYEAYKHFYKDPADKEAAALANAQSQSNAQAQYIRQLMLSGANRGLSFYGPARDVLRQMMGGTPPSGYGVTSQGPTAQPVSPNVTGASTKAPGIGTSL